MTDPEHATADVEMVQIEDQSQQQHVDNDGSRNKNDDPFRDENHHDENHEADSSAPLELLLPLVPASVALCTTRASSTTVEPFSIEAFSDKKKKKQRARSDEDDVLTCGICACRYRTYVLLCCLIIATIVASIYVYDLHHVASVDDINNINNNHKVSDDNSVGGTSSSSSTNTNTNDERTKNKNKNKNTNKNKKHHHQHDTDATTKKKNEQEEGTTTTTTATTTATTNTPPSTQNDNTDLHNWWNATVTKHDGIQYEIVGTIQHDKNAFLEGLAFGREDGLLYESVGLNGQSDVRVLDPKTGATLHILYTLSGTYFGEGLTYRHEHLYQLTYKQKTLFVYTLPDEGTPHALVTATATAHNSTTTTNTKKNILAVPHEYSYDTITHEGWGFTWDPERDEFIVSDGSAKLLFWSTEPPYIPLRTLDIYRLSTTTTTTKKDGTSISQRGPPARQINELEYWRGRILANVWYEDVILVIHPSTGVVEKEYDFSHLYPKTERRKNRAGVLNGISISQDPDVLYITGKNWDKMFLIKLLF